MSFISVPGPHYIKRTLIYVNSDNRDPIRSTNNFDFSFNLKEEIQEVFSLELVNYSIPRITTPTLLGEVDIFSVYRTGALVLVPQNSNMRYDLLIEDELRAASVLIEGSMDPAFFLGGLALIPTSGLPLDYDSFLLLFLFDLDARFSLAIAGTFFDPDYQFGVNIDNNYRLTLFLVNTAAIPTTYGFISVLFGTGPNRDNQMSIPLGFQPNVDQEPDQTTAENLLVAPYSLNMTQFVYLDIDLAQASEVSPWARIYTADENLEYSSPLTTCHRSRMLKTPVRNLKFLDFRIRAQAGRLLSEVSNTGIDMTVEALSISQVPSVPTWVQQRLTL